MPTKMELLLCMSSKAASPTAANGINKKGGFNGNDADTWGKRGKLLVDTGERFLYLHTNGFYKYIYRIHIQYTLFGWILLYGGHLGENKTTLCATAKRQMSGKCVRLDTC